jgi:hypothetical protein
VTEARDHPQERTQPTGMNGCRVPSAKYTIGPDMSRSKCAREGIPVMRRALVPALSCALVAGTSFARPLGPGQPKTHTNTDQPSSGIFI